MYVYMYTYRVHVHVDAVVYMYMHMYFIWELFTCMDTNNITISWKVDKMYML